MGPCASKSKRETERTNKIDNVLQDARLMRRKEIKLLLLGTGESGKSTIFKQIQILHNHGFDEDLREELVPTIRKHTIENFVELFKGAVLLGFLDDLTQSEIKTLLQKIDQEGVSESSISQISDFWLSQPFQDALKMKSSFQLGDSVEHFLSSIHRIFEATYLPTDQDILACRVRTTGVSNFEFESQNVVFKLVDVGGQRNERRKWIHCFEDVHAVVFVTAISEYDQKLFEDEKTNRLQESVNLFEEIANTRFFSDAGIILLLNKKDLFAEKIKHVDLSVCFSDYTEGCSYDHAIDFLKQKFQSKAQAHDVFVHVTCATNTGNIRFVFDSVKEFMLMQNVAAAGLL